MRVQLAPVCLVTLAVVAASIAGPAPAFAAAQKRIAPETHATVTVPEGTTGGTPATLALIYSPHSGVTLSKGVKAFTALGFPGVFCITPTSRLKATALPIVQVEWSQSSQVLNQAQWNRLGQECASGDIEVITVDQVTGTLAADVAFTVEVF